MACPALSSAISAIQYCESVSPHRCVSSRGRALCHTSSRPLKCKGVSRPETWAITGRLRRSSQCPNLAVCWRVSRDLDVAATGPIYCSRVMMRETESGLGLQHGEQVIGLDVGFVLSPLGVGEQAPRLSHLNVRLCDCYQRRIRLLKPCSPCLYKSTANNGGLRFSLCPPIQRRHDPSSAAFFAQRQQ